MSERGCVLGSVFFVGEVEAKSIARSTRRFRVTATRLEAEKQEAGDVHSSARYFERRSVLYCFFGSCFCGKSRNITSLAVVFRDSAMVGR